MGRKKSLWVGKSKYEGLKIVKPARLNYEGLEVRYLREALVNCPANSTPVKIVELARKLKAENATLGTTIAKFKTKDLRQDHRGPGPVTLREWEYDLSRLPRQDIIAGLEAHRHLEKQEKDEPGYGENFRALILWHMKVNSPTEIHAYFARIGDARKERSTTPAFV